MKCSSPMDIQDLREKRAAFRAVEAACAAVTQAHIAMRMSGLMDGCEEAMNLTRDVVKRAKERFRAAYEAEEDRLDEEGAQLLHRAIYGQSAAPGLLAAARAALHYMRLHKYADQAWADDLEAAIAAVDAGYRGSDE